MSVNVIHLPVHDVVGAVCMLTGAKWKPASLAGDGQCGDPPFPGWVFVGTMEGGPPASPFCWCMWTNGEQTAWTACGAA